MEVPAHIQAIAERTATEQALVDFIVKERGTEERLLAIISDKEPSKWLMGFQGKSPNKVPVYLDNDAQQDRLFKYLETVLNSISSPVAIRNHILFILEVLLPEPDSQPEMRCASFWVLLALLAASPVYSVRIFVNIGRSLTLPCYGDPSRHVKWRFQQYGYPDWLDLAVLYTGSFSSGNGFQGRVESFHLKDPGNYSLLLSPVVYSDLGIYKCQYIDGIGIILSDVKLEIREPSNVSIAMGMSASLPCFGKINIQAHADDLDILWKRGGENVYQLLKNTTTYGPGFENRASVSPEQAVYGNMSLTIRQTRFSDEGDYQCFYNSPKERGNPDSASLVVTGHPPQTLTVKAGGLLSIPLYTADPVRVTFSAGLGSDEVLMLDANKGPARYGERCAQRCELLAQNYTLLLKSVTLEHAGVYKVTDPETNKTIGSVSLQVSGRSAGAVAGIVVGVLVLAGSAFAVWKFFRNLQNSVHFRAARAEDH